MASIGTEGERGELKRILFRDEDGKQQSIRLGACPKSAAETARVAIGHLVIAKRHGSVPHPDAVRWLDGIDDVLYDRVVKHGLCQPHEVASVVTLANLLDQYDKAVVVKPATRYKYRQVEDSLREFLGADIPLASITPAHADNWRKWIAEPKANPRIKAAPARKPARATVAKRVVIARGIFWKAVRWGHIASNPFADLRAGSQSNPDRAHFVTVETTRSILAECPDDQWRAIVGLSRFAGLRCPSEIVALRWDDVNWEKWRLTVRSPKTAGYEGHAVRLVPIDPELQPILQSLFDRAEVGVEAIVPRLHDQTTNLRTQFERIIAKAGVKPWPRLFQNLRASCETEWVGRFPAHEVAKWAGHSPLIAAQHYLQTRDVYSDLAAGVDVTKAAANPAAHTRPRDPTDKHDESINPRNLKALVKCGVGCDPMKSM